jgi:hypothetical protein
VKLHQLRLQSVKVLILSQNDPVPLAAVVHDVQSLHVYAKTHHFVVGLVRQNGDPPGAEISKNVAALGNDDIFDSSVLDCLTFGSVNGAIYRLGDFQGPSNLTDAAADFGYSALGGHLVVFAPASGKNILEEDSDWLK